MHPEPDSSLSPAADSAPEGVAGRPDQTPEANLTTWRAQVSAHGGPNTLLWADQGIALDITHAHPGGLAKLLAGRDTRLSELYREPAASARAFANAKAIRAKQQELARERGVPGSYLAVGRAWWNITRGPRPNAPVFLRRCELVPEDATEREFVVVGTGEVEFNPALRSFLLNAGGHDVPFDALVSMAMRSSGFDPSSAYDVLRKTVVGLPGWSINPDLWLTTFHYAKLAAAADFSRIADDIPAHPVLGRLAGPAGTSGPPRPAEIHQANQPDDVTVLDADPSQLAVLEAVRAGHTVVVDAGPGTGKSQTIVNIAADQARRGRSTLIVAAPSGSRATIAGRLAHLGLAELLHEADAPATARPRPRRDPVRAAAPQSDWTTAGRELADHLERMHRPRLPWQVTLDQIQDRIATLGAGQDPPRSKVRLDGPTLAGLGSDELAHWQQTLTDVASRGAWSGGHREADPWWGAAIDGEGDLARAQAALAALSPAGLTRLDATFEDVFAGVDIPRLPRLVDHGDFVAEMAVLKEVLGVFRIGIFDAPLEDWVGRNGVGALDRWRSARAVKSYLRPGTHPADLTPLLRQALAVRPLWRAIRGSQVLPTQVAGLDRARSAYDQVAAQASFLSARLPGALDLAALPLDELTRLVSRLSTAEGRLRTVAAVTSDLERARAAGLGDLVADLAARAVPAEQVARNVEFVWWTSLLAEVTAADPAYARATGDPVRAAATRFRDVDRSLQRAVAAGLAADRSGREPLVWLTSPMGVGLHVPAERSFDLVIVDEASSLTVWESASALARAGQAVIIGDSHLPGPRAFTATTGGVPKSMAADRSLLAAAAAHWPVFGLQWHYRSHDERLIDPVARAVYGGAMRTLPVPSDTGGFTVERVAAQGGSGQANPTPADTAGVDPARGDSAEQGSPMQESTDAGVAPEVSAQAGLTQPGSARGESTQVATARSDQGRAESRQADADAVVTAAVAAAVDHARVRPTDSLAIVTVEPGLADRIRAAMPTALDPDAEFFTRGGPEPFAVLDAARLAGVTRDAVVVAFGPDAPGEVAAGDGLRLLTAALTRARARLTIIHAVDRDRTGADPGTVAPGTQLLMSLLHGTRSTPAPEPVSVLVTDLARRLRARGLRVRLGVAPGAVDLAVSDPFTRGAPATLGVAVDGPAYAAIPGVRMRDRIVYDQLRRLGWRPLRLLTVDLFRDPAREEARVVAALERIAGGELHTGPVPTRGARRAMRPATGGHAATGGHPVVTPAPAAEDADDSTDDAPPEDSKSVAKAAVPESRHDRWLRENRPPHWD